VKRRPIFAGVFLVTLSVLMLELAVTRLFSATMYYHYAFMAISLALFGSGASGVFVYLVQRRLSEERTGTWLALSSVLMALSVPLALYAILNEPLSNDLGGAANYSSLAKIYTATALPFFFAGCVVTLSITRLAADVARLYLFDLAGAAAGCLLLIPVLNTVGAINTLLLVAAVAAGAGAVFTTATSGGRAVLGFCLVCAVGFAALVGYNHHTGRIDVREAKGWQEEDVIFSKWNSFSRITVSGKPLQYDFLQIRIDSDAGTMITRNGSATRLHEGHRQDLEAIPYHLAPDASVLIIGPGGGNDVMIARLFEPKKVTAVEVNPIIARDVMGSEPFRSFSGDLFRQPGVRLVVDEGRSFIRGSSEQYDIILGTMVDTWAATAAGAFALTENNLYTVEAFNEYADHLTDDGILTMTRWYFEPPDQMLRLVSLTRAMMAEKKIGEAAEHIIVLRGAPDPAGGRSPATFLFKKSPLTPGEVRTVEAIAGERGFEILYSPATRPPNVFTQLIEARHPADVWDGFASNIAPPRDNNPFFFNTIRPGDVLEGLQGSDEWRKTNLGTFVLFALLVITAGLVLLFIIGPLVVARRRDLATGTPRKLAHLLYFACLGAGFIIVEVAMIQKFILFLGHPVYSLAVVLFSLLLFSGMGSWLSGRIEGADLRPPLVKALVVLAALVLVYVVVLPPIFYNLVQLALPARILIAVLLMAPLAIVMGMPMPTGIRILARGSPEMVPWAWGVNGATSVMGSVAALVIAILTGFNQALVVGASLYLAAILFVARPVRQPDPLPVAEPQPEPVNV
jgi:predicted membrane-bound spermidine synthase